MAEGYREFVHTYEDFSGEDVEVRVRLRKPTAQEINRCTSGLRKDMLQSFKNLLLDVVHPEEKEALKARLESDYGLAATFGNEVLERCGFGQLGK